MKIESIKRPWVKNTYGKRSNPDPFYQSSVWKKVKQSFKLGTTILPDGRTIPNTICVECYKKGIIKDMYAVDHIVRIKDGGSRTDHSNLQGLCERHHAIKSSEEGRIKSNPEN